MGGINSFLRDASYSSQKDVIVLTAYYLEFVEDNDTVGKNQIMDCVEAAKVNIPRNHVHTYLSRLSDSGDLIEHSTSEYSLSFEAENGVLELLEDSQQNSDSETCFLEYDDIDDGFYQELVEDINASYRHELYDATLVLSRKFLENMVLDLLRLRYGLDSENIQLFYDTDNGRLLGFSRLLDNLKENIEDFEYFTDRLDESVIRDVEELKGRGDASAHSIEVGLESNDISDFREKFNYVTPILHYTKQAIESAASRSEN